MNYRNSGRWTRFECHWSRTRNMRCNYSPLFLSTPLFICICNTVAFGCRCATSTHANHRWDTNLTTQLSSQFRPPAQRISCCMCAHTKNLGYATSRRTNDPLLPSERGQGRGCVARTLDLFLVARSRLRRLRNDKFVHAPHRVNHAGKGQESMNPASISNAKWFLLYGYGARAVKKDDGSTLSWQTRIDVFVFVLMIRRDKRI